jgi:hypothetical protein
MHAENVVRGAKIDFLLRLIPGTAQLSKIRPGAPTDRIAQDRRQPAAM